MALQVWLPLNGNLNSQGLTDVTLSSGTPTYTAGKIGQCLSTGSLLFNVSNNLVTTLGSTNIYSMCCWCKNLDTSTGARWVFGMSNGTGTMRGLWESNSSTSRHWAYSGSGTNLSTTINTIDGNWHHLCFTSTGSTVKLYVDGIYQSQSTSASTTAMTTNTITLNANNYNLNDFRIYDHTLSPREVAEIAKGLVLHYPLNREGFGCDNILAGNYSCVTTATTHTTSGTATLSGINDLFVANKGKTLWFSFDYSCEGTRNSNTGRSNDFGNRYGAHLSFRYTDTNGTLSSQMYPCAAYLGMSGTGTAIQSYTIPSDLASVYNFGISLQPYAAPASGNTATWYLKNFKIEIGDKATPWTPNSSDALYAKMGLDSNVVYDVSGFGYNGIDNNIHYSSDTPMYSVCSDFQESTTSYITTPAMTIDMTDVTFSVWAKWDAFNSWSRVFDFGEKTGGAGYSFLVANNGSNLVVAGRLAGGASLPDTTIMSIATDTWYHIAVTVSGSTCSTYVNGSLVKSFSFNGSMGMATFNNNYLGKSNWTADKLFEGQISDFRIYSTALSAQQVLELYQTPISLAYNGVLLSAELQE